MTLTAVPGIRVGHATHPDGHTGCTVVLGPFRAAARISGMATGTRELDTLDPEHLVERVHAILLTGGSAFGLAAAGGVMGWLEERGEGVETPNGLVPIVPAAVIYDLKPGAARPDAGMARAACEAASADPVAPGRIGVGAGATVGKLGGIENAAPGGVGSASAVVGDHSVGALTVVNAVGDVLAEDGSLIAGGGRGSGPRLMQNTTLSVVATDAPMSRVGLRRLARMADTALARRIRPVNTPFDGDVTFAVGTADSAEDLPREEFMALGMAAAEVLARAIEIAVTSGGSGD